MNEASFATGIVLVVSAGIVGGCWAAPIKLMRVYAFEHWLFLMALIGQLILPWLVTFLLCPEVVASISDIPAVVFVKANFFSMAWGIANILYGICLARIGFSLTIGIMTGIGLPIGVIVPMLLKGSGKFADAPSLLSSAGMIILIGITIMLFAVVLSVLAGYGREQSSIQRTGRRFTLGLVIAGVIGVLQIGLVFAFVYSQGPITEALIRHGAEITGASFGVWAFAMPGGAATNIAFAIYLMSNKKSWRVLTANPHDLCIGLVVGLGFFLVFALMGAGMRLLGPLGPSVGFGVIQAFQIISSQVLGFVLGEWRETNSESKNLMLASVGIMLVAVVVMALGRAF